MPGRSASRSSSKPSPAATTTASRPPSADAPSRNSSKKPPAPATACKSGFAGWPAPTCTSAVSAAVSRTAVMIFRSKKSSSAGTAAAKTSSACSPASTICASMTIHRKPTPPPAGSPTPFCSSKCNKPKSPLPPTSPTPPTGPSPSSPPPSTCTPQSRARRPRRAVSHRARAIGKMPMPYPNSRLSPPPSATVHSTSNSAICTALSAAPLSN